MYLVPLKTTMVEALRAVFDSEYPVETLRGINTSIEFPITQSEMPSYWINYDDTAEISIVGIGHEEVVVTDEFVKQQTRWRFEGTVTITAVALSSLERDTMYDELVRVFAFGRYTQPTNQFRSYLENNDLIAIQPNFDDLRPSGDNSALGTPWETREMVYEKSLSFDVIGEFVGDPLTQQLVPIGDIRVHPYVQGHDPVPDPPADPGYTATSWI